MSDKRLRVSLPGLDLKIQLFQHLAALALDKNMPSTMT